MHMGIAEDDPDLQDLLRLWLDTAQHSVSAFSSVADFIDALKRERFELLLIDWMLPDGTGAELLAWARRNLGWELPILVLTSRDDEELRSAFVDHPDSRDDDFMTKLHGQMKSASLAGRLLMAEMMWVLLLFPSNIGAENKRQHVQEIWSWSEETLPTDSPMLQS